MTKSQSSWNKQATKLRQMKCSKELCEKQGWKLLERERERESLKLAETKEKEKDRNSKVLFGQNEWKLNIVAWWNPSF